MLDQIYSFRGTEQKLRQGPLGAFIDELVTVLLEKGYPERYLRDRFAVIGEFSRWLIRNKIKLCNLDQPSIDRFIQYRSKQTSVAGRGEKVTLNFLFEILSRHGSIPTPQPKRKQENETEKLLREYNEHLVEERGLSPSTIFSYIPNIRYFLSNLLPIDKPADLSNTIDAQKITEFVRKYANKHGSVVSGMMVSSLRSFFRFLLLRGKVSVDLASCVPSVANWKHTRTPQYLSPQELRHLLEHSKGRSPLEIRNYAILLILARLGLRASEVVMLTLDDIDWKRGEINIRGKGGKHARLPLPVDVGEALVDYLKNGRPSCSTRRVFISSRAPLKPFKNHVAVSTIVHRCLERASLNAAKKGAHLLRHTLATECLRKGATLPEVGEILRHKQVDTTAIYAKVDFKELIKIAQPWPDASVLEGMK